MHSRQAKEDNPFVQHDPVPGLYEYYLYSGRIDFIRQMVPTMKKMLEKYRNYLRDNLPPTPVEDCYWNYYECADGLNGQGPDDKKSFAV